MDKLIVKGLGKPLDGEYEFEIADFVAVGRPGSLTMREAHRIKVMTGIRAGEIEEAFIAGDSDLLAALSAIIITRSGTPVNEEALWESRVGQLDWDLEALRPEVEDVKESEEDPPVKPAETPETETPSESGGASSKPIAVPPVNDRSPTGQVVSGRSSTFAQLTSVS